MLKNSVMLAGAVTAGYVAAKVADYFKEYMAAVKNAYEQFNADETIVTTVFGYRGIKSENIAIVVSNKILDQYRYLDVMTLNLGNGKYMIVISDDLYKNYPAEAVKAMIYHEIGHIVNGDLDDVKRAKEMRRDRVKEEPDYLNSATYSEVLADRFAAELMDDSDAVCEALQILQIRTSEYYQKHKISAKLNEERSEKEITFRLEAMKDWTRFDERRISCVSEKSEK